MSSRSRRPKTYLAQPAPAAFCPGCGYQPYVEHLDRALVHLAIDPASVAIVTDIGCIGAVDCAFAVPHTMHTTHGRSVAFATGLELADAILHDSRLKTIVAVGDGGAAAGLAHLLNAAQMNVDVTVLVANNYLLGLSGGQPSCARPGGAQQTASAGGRLVPPLDLCVLAAQCGAGFVARASGDDPDLWQTMADAIRHPGFAVVEIDVACPRYSGDGKAVDRGLAGSFGRGATPLEPGFTRPEFGDVYLEAVGAEPPLSSSDEPMPRLYSSPLAGSHRWVIAGSTGQHVEWAGEVLLRAGAISGSRVTQKSEHRGLPGTGADLSEVCVSTEAIGDVACDAPDVVVVVSAEGLADVRASGRLDRLPPGGVLVIDESLLAPGTSGRVIRGPFRALCTPSRAAMAAVVAANACVHTVPERALLTALGLCTPGDVSVYHEDATRMLGRLEG